MRFLGRTGLISEVQREGRGLTVQWQIRNFFSLSGKGADYYESPDFDFGNACWCLKIYSNGQTRNPPSGCVGFYLVRKDSSPPVAIQFKLWIQGENGVEKRGEAEYNFTKNLSLGWSEFIQRQMLRDHQAILMPDNLLIVACSMKSVVPSAARAISSCQESFSQTDGKFTESSVRTGERQSLNKQDASIQTDEEFMETKALTEENHTSGKHGLEKVVEDIGKMLVSGENSDVTVRVGDVEFKVHRNILSARSSVLSAMFKHETAERASKKIVIEDCDPDVFREYLQYLYTGSVRSLSKQNVFGLYRVADKYLADDLKLQCLEHIRNTLSVQTFCDAVQLALTYGESDLLQLAVEFASEHIRSIIRSVEWQHFSRDHHTEANEILIKSLGPPN